MCITVHSWQCFDFIISYGTLEAVLEGLSVNTKMPPHTASPCLPASLKSTLASLPHPPSCQNLTFHSLLGQAGMYCNRIPRHAFSPDLPLKPLMRSFARAGKTGQRLQQRLRIRVNSCVCAFSWSYIFYLWLNRHCSIKSWVKKSKVVRSFLAWCL